MDKEKLIESARKLVWPHFADNMEIAKSPKIFVEGDGCHLYDIDGNRYLDTFASLTCSIYGHKRPEIAAAVQEQMQKLEFFPNYVDAFTPPLIELTEKLVDILPGELEAVFYVNSGSEACETAIKMAKQYFWEQGKRDRFKIAGRRYSYHGTTLGGISATGIPWFREPFQPLLPGFLHGASARCYRCEMGLKPDSCGLECLEDLKRTIIWEGPETVAAVIIDPVPGSNIGYPAPPDGYLAELREFCSSHGILLIFDEVQTGFCKTGKMFACEHWDVAPDIMALGKGFSGGYIPLGAAAAASQIYDVFRKPGSEFRSGGTYGGHTVACAVALENLRIIERENLTEKARSTGAYIRSRLEELYKYPVVGDVRGIGMLLAVELVADKRTKAPFGPDMPIGAWIRDYCWKNGMILRNNGDILVVAPALIMTRGEAREMTEKIDEAIRSAVKHFGL